MKVHAGTGWSTVQDAADAGREAAAAAVAALEGEMPALVIVFTTPRYDLPRLLAAIRSVTGDAQLVGETGSGAMIRDHFLAPSAGVGVLALTAGGYRFGVASASGISEDLDGAGQQIARASRAAAGPSPHAAVILLADALAGDLQQLVQGVYRVTGPRVAIVGGAAGDDQKFVSTSVFHGDSVIKSGAVALWIASDHPLKVVTRHGWRPIGVPMLVTRAEGTTVLELGGRPAAEAYEAQLGLSPGQLTPDNFWGTSIRHPFGLLQSDGSAVIRVARSKTPQGGLRIQGCLAPDGSAIQVMAGDTDSLLAVVDEVAEGTLATLPEPGVLISFSCAARIGIYKERAAEEAQRLQAAADKVPNFGVYCCGEFARTSGVLATHNASLTGLAL
jgi:hypothetical protein